MVSPKVSVVLPFHQPGDFFREALNSTISQQGVAFELILVANNPDHHSMQTANTFASEYKNVCLVQEHQQGISHALNCGLRHCKGTYIARMDADDCMLPGRLELQSAYLDAHKDAGVVSGLVVLETAPDLQLQNDGMVAYVDTVNALLTHTSMYDHRFIDAPLIHPSVMFRQELIQQHGNYHSGELPEDYEMWLRWMETKVQFAKIPQPVLKWRDHALRLTRSANAYSSNAFDKVRMHYLSRAISNQKKQDQALWIWGAGRNARKKIQLLPSHSLPVTGYIDVDMNATVERFPVIHFTAIPPPGAMFIVSLVTNRGKYREIRSFLEEKGYVEGTDFLIGA